MTKTIIILAISMAFVVGSIATGTIAFADDEETPLFFSWDPADTSSDPNNLIIITATFSRIGLLSDSTTDVQGEFEGLLKGDSENESETTVTTTVGPNTISTTVIAESHDADGLEGEIQIDGDTFEAKLSLVESKTTTAQVNEEFSGPSGTQTLEQKKLTIPVTIEMCTDDDKCFEGFGIIRRESSQTTSGGFSITFTTDALEAEVIGDSGLFDLKMSRLQRTVETIP